MKRLAVILVIILFFAVAIYIIFLCLGRPALPAQPQPAFTFLLSSSTPQPASVNDQVFYANQSGLFSYDVAAHKTLQIAAVNASTSIFNGRRIGDDTIGFEVGQAYSSKTSSVYMLDLASDTLTKETDVGGDAGWYVDNLEFVAPGEFVYTEASTTAGMLDNYDRVFLFKDGTTTQIGYISNPGEYGSTLSSAPDGNHLFFAGQIYSMAAKTWIPVSGTCKGPESTWLNNNVVILKWESDYNAGNICYYDITSGAEGDVGLAGGFNVMGGDIFSMQYATTVPALFQISQYNYAAHAARVVIPNARFWSYYSSDMNGFPGVVYEPVTSSGTCQDPDCFGGVATGSLMMFDPATGSSTPLGFGAADDVRDIF
jgi:hypothetical protein